jgi:lysyl-tRNA synthetase class 2
MPSPGVIRNNLIIRARIIDAIRQFFRKGNFIEVETPVRYPHPAPEAHIDAFESDGWYLSTSPELHMKRLLADGFNKIFQITRCFRKGELGKQHNPEFTMLEWYRTGGDYMTMLEDLERMFVFLCNKLGKSNTLNFRGSRIDVSRPWPVLTVDEAFMRYAGWLPGPTPDLKRFELDLIEKVEPSLERQKPMILKDYPASMCSLSRLGMDNPNVAERLEVYIGGMELANAFSELVDSKEQRARFNAENNYRKILGKQTYPVPEEFLKAIERMPASGGCALGIDRLVMLFCNAGSINEVVAFNHDTA